MLGKIRIGTNLIATKPEEERLLVESELWADRAFYKRCFPDQVAPSEWMSDVIADILYVAAERLVKGRLKQ